MWKFFRTLLVPVDIVSSIFRGDCRHLKRSRPFTIRGRTYRTCLDCGQEIDYDWEQMRDMSSEEAEAAKGKRGSQTKAGSGGARKKKGTTAKPQYPKYPKPRIVEAEPETLGSGAETGTGTDGGVVDDTASRLGKNEAVPVQIMDWRRRMNERKR